MSANSPLYPISKSQYLNFTRCSNSFYLLNQQIYNKNSSPHRGSLEWFDFVSLCQSYFENPVAISKLTSREDQQSQTTLAIQKRHTIFYGLFSSETFSSTVECLMPNREDDSWILYDFRPVGSQKLDILRSLFFQRKLLTSLAINVSACKVIRIHSDYELLDSGIESDKFLLIDDATERLIREDLRFEAEWNLFCEYLKSMNFPIHEEIYPSCKSPKSCYIRESCFKDIDDFEIFDLREGHDLPKKLYAEGIKKFSEIPDSELTAIQKIQKQAHTTGIAHFDLDQLRLFFSGTTETVAFLDFETINPYIPMFPNSNPFQHIPFLFSLHIWNTSTGELTHFNYIHPPENGEPRCKLISELARLLPSDITIFSFNDYFEKQIIADLVKIHLEYTEFWEQVRPNFKDLALPFKKFWVYSPKQKGKASLKEILPAFSDFNHHELAIKEGQDANYQYLRLLKKQVTQEEKNRVLEDLVSYCNMDTYGLFLLYKMLKNKIE